MAGREVGSAGPDPLARDELEGGGAGIPGLGDLARLRAAVIHISTGLFVHSFTGADLRLYPNYPQIYAQAVILAAQRAVGERESREEAVILRGALSSGEREGTLMRIAC